MFKEVEISYKKDLEQLCFMILGGMEAGVLGVNDEKGLYLKKYIGEMLEFIVENDNVDDNIFKEKYDELNKLCDDIDKDVEGKYESRIIDDYEDQNDGMSIEALKKMKSK
jgi:hypothetical protein